MNTVSSLPALIICGPTGVGKSDIAERIADQIPAEIVNIDVGQFYTPLSVGTAKPNWRASHIHHHLFDSINEPRDYSITEYRNLVVGTVQDIWQRNKIPLLVGGSSFYVQALFFPSVAPDCQRQEYTSYTDAWHELNAIDPQRAAMIHKNDIFRISKAFSYLAFNRQKTIRLYGPFCTNNQTFYTSFLTRERELLYKRINERVEIMMRQGWVDEVAGLKGMAWELFFKKEKNY